MDRPNTQTGSDGQIDILRLVQALWGGKTLIVATTIAALMLGVGVSLMLPNIYRAEVLLAPNERDSAGGLSSLADQYGGLASLAGISFGGDSADKTVLGIETLKSRKFISEFVNRHNLWVPLFAAEGWNVTTGELEIDSDVYDADTQTWVRDIKPPRTEFPSAQEAYEEFSDLLFVGQDGKTGLVTVSVEHYSPHLARQWVDWLIEDLNASVMHQDVVEAEHAITYLNEQIENTSLAEMQSIFFALIMEQTKTVMLARVSPEYLFKTVDPAVVPELKVKPKRAIICILFCVFGFGIGVVAVLARSGRGLLG